jgi:membrane protein YdbS with pleckstrin-like domain
LTDRQWAIVRMILGLAQVMGAAGSLGLLLATGMNRWSLAAAAATCLFTIVSVFLFGDRTRPGRQRKRA